MLSFRIILIAKLFNLGDPRELDALLKDINAANTGLLSAAREEEKNKADPQRRKDLANALDELERLLPQQIKAVKEAKERPRDANAVKQAVDMTAQLKDAIDAVVKEAKASPKDEVANAAQEEAEELDRLMDAVKKEDAIKAAQCVKVIGTFKKQSNQGLLSCITFQSY